MTAANTHASAVYKAALGVKSLPPCARDLGCLCAGHARGNSPKLPCDTNEHGAITDPKTILRDNAGAVLSRRCKVTNTTVTLYDADDPNAGMDGHEARWWTVCENHACLCSHDSRAIAESHLSHPDEWCEVCMGNEPAL